MSEQFEKAGDGLLVRAPVPPEFLYEKNFPAGFSGEKPNGAGTSQGFANDGGIYAKLNIFSFASRKIKE
jgi:hypothetical protein